MLSIAYVSTLKRDAGTASKQHQLNIIVFSVVCSNISVLSVCRTFECRYSMSSRGYCLLHSDLFEFFKTWNK